MDVTDKNVSESETDVKTEPEAEPEAKLEVEPEAEVEAEPEVEAENEIDAQDVEPVMIIDADEQGAGDPVPDEADEKADKSASAKKRAWSPKRIALVVVGIVLICIGAMFGLRSCDAVQTGGATLGTYDGKSQEEIQAELDRRAKDSMMTVSIDITPELSRDGQALNLRAQNVKENKFDQKIEIVQDDEVKGTYLGLKPGEKIDDIEVKGLEEGEAVVTVYALEPDTDTVHGNPSSFEVEVHRAE